MFHGDERLTNRQLVKTVEAPDDAIWLRQDKESVAAYTAFIDYVEMGEGRSYSKLLDMYMTADNPPTKRKRTIDNWARRFKWQERLDAYTGYATGSILKDRKALRELVIDNGVADYLDMLDLWKRNVSKMLNAKTPPAPDDLNDMMTSRKKIEELGRLAVGMPLSITENTNINDNTDRQIRLIEVRLVTDGGGPDVVTVEPAALPSDNDEAD